jgi:hypothetical protein
MKIGPGIFRASKWVTNHWMSKFCVCFFLNLQLLSVVLYPYSSERNVDYNRFRPLNTCRQSTDLVLNL